MRLSIRGRWLIAFSHAQKPVWASELSLIGDQSDILAVELEALCLWRMPLIATSPSHLIICLGARHLILSALMASAL